MDEQQRDSSWVCTLMVHNMDLHVPEPIHTDGNDKLVELLIQLLFLSTPIEIVPPGCNQALDLGQGGTHIPARIVELVGIGRLLELLAELIELGIRNGNGERFNRDHFGEH